MIGSAGHTFQLDIQGEKLPDWHTTACEALDQRRCLEVDHGQFSRTVEVHRVGIGPRGEHLISGWQVCGPEGERVGWKLINIADCIRLTLSDIASRGPRPDYRRGTKQFVGVIAQL